jgi:hypothetical protein
MLRAGSDIRGAALALLVGILGGCGRASAPLPESDQPLALLAVPTLDGPTFDVGSLTGKTVVVAFWSPG